MEKLVGAFIDHLKSALEIEENFNASITGEINNVIVLGMGGSGIGGSIAAEVLSDEISIPVLSCKDYSIPAFVSEKTLVIACSYSGNTEETLTALEDASKKTKNIICICSGGKIEKIAKERGYAHIVIPGGMPPRAAFGYSFPQLFKAFISSGLIQWDLKKAFNGAISMLESEKENINELARQIAHKLADKLPIIYSESGYEGVGIRFRQQLNENSKKLCWHHVFPEMNHNELVGWRENANGKAVVFLRNDSDLSRNQKRMELSREIFKKYNPEIIEIFSKGNNKLERSLYLIHLCDWISIFIAEINNIDPVEIDVINYLKSELAKA